MPSNIDPKLNEALQCVNRFLTQLELLKESFMKEMQFHFSILQNELKKQKESENSENKQD